MQDDYFMPKPTYNKAVVFNHNNKWFIHGYNDNGEVDTIGGWDTFAEHENAKLYDKNGNEIPHEYENIPTLEEQVAIMRAAIYEMADEMYG